MSMTFGAFTSAGSGGGSAFQRVIDPSQLGMFLNLEAAEMQRLKRYTEYWRFYLGQHWQFTREDGEPLVTLNYVQLLVDKATAWLVGQDMTIKVPDALKDHTLPVLQEVWEYNNQGQTLYDIGTVGGVTGDAFILVTYVEPTAQAKRINPHTEGRIRIQLIGSEQVYPQWDPMNIDVLKAVRIETIFYDDRNTDIQDGSQQQGRQLQARRWTQTITATEIIEQFQGGERISKPNPLGEISLVHIKNKSVPGEYYGLSDVVNVVDLNRELNEKATDISDIVNYHAAPVTIIQGAKVRNLDRSARNIWSGLPADAKVYNLELQGDLAASLNYFGTIKNSMLEIAQTPAATLGEAQAISNTSGTALHTQHQPLIEKTNRKKTTYQPGIEQINYYILRIKETVDPSFILRTDLCRHCGGRIVEFVEPYQGKRRKCYMVEPQTFEFMNPDDVKIKYVRQHSFGQKVEEATFSQVKAEAGVHAPSFWDPTPSMSADEKAAQDHEELLKQVPPEVSVNPETGAEKRIEGFKPETPIAQVPQMPMEAIELPAEPEKVTLRIVQYDTVTGNEISSTDTVVDVVPTGCERSEYLNPYFNTVLFNDTVPKDKQLVADLMEKYQKNGWVSKRWIRKQITEVEDPEAMEKEIEDEASDAIGQAQSQVDAAAAEDASNKSAALQVQNADLPIGNQGQTGGQVT